LQENQKTFSNSPTQILLDMQEKITGGFLLDLKWMPKYDFRQICDEENKKDIEVRKKEVKRCTIKKIRFWQNLLFLMKH